MRQLALALATVLLLGLAPTAVGAQPSCELAPVFAPFREAIGSEVVGECSAEPTTAPNGDITQMTTRGTLFARGADGLLLFSNDTTSWLAGPEGLQSRPNGELLPWEVASNAATTPSTPQQPAQPPAGPSKAALEQRCSDIVNGAPDRGQPTRDQQWGICVQLAEQYGAPGVECYAEATRKIAPNIGKVSRETTNALFDASLTACKAGLR